MLQFLSFLLIIGARSSPSPRSQGASTGKKLTASAKGTQSTALIDEISLFVAPITIGNGQIFKMILDTGKVLKFTGVGSSDTWFRGPQCKSLNNDASCDGTTVNLQDKTIVNTEKKFLQVYGASRVEGDIANVPVTMGSQKFKIPVGITTSERGFDEKLDGIIGFGHLIFRARL